MKLLLPDPPSVEEVGLPSVPCRLTPELAERLNFPDIEAVIAAYLERDDAPLEIVVASPAGERKGGLHVSHLGHSRYGGLCQRQLHMELRIPAGGPSGAPDGWGRKFMWQEGHVKEAWLAGILTIMCPEWRVERNLIADIVHTSGMVITGEADILMPQPPFRRVIVDAKAVDDAKLVAMDSPRPSNVCQIQGYGYPHETEFEVLVYMGRSEGVKAFYVPRDDVATMRRCDEVIAVAQSPDAPEALSPKKVLGPELKDGSRSVKVGLPWQCQYCKFLDHGCDGALAKPCRQNGIWGHLKDGKFKTKPGMEPVVDEFGHDRLARLLLED